MSAQDERNAPAFAAPGGQVNGVIGLSSHSVPVDRTVLSSRQAMASPERREAVERVASGVAAVAFALEAAPGGTAVLHLFDHRPSVEPGFGSAPGALILDPEREWHTSRREPGLLAALIRTRGGEDPRPIVALANEVLALRGRPLAPGAVTEPPGRAVR
ncbi:hypothetical protein ACIA8O_02500 [Kitasatospora sp. NPDC051853]|uniref:hypothetical protein n=1 Tax=Kitasatospora sp. NPDC051853 TaxID=3364058 RepID=UPI0037AD4494